MTRGAKTEPVGRLPRRKIVGRRRTVWRILKWGFVAGAGLVLGGIALLLGMFAYYGSDPNLPDVSRLRNWRPYQVTRLLSAEGHLIAEIYKERRTVVGRDKIPKLLIQATVAAEDARFFQHKGLDKFGMLRAFFANLRAGRYVQGGSTLTQQLVKTIFLSPRKTLKRKVQELILARRLEESFTKEEIITFYLNQVYYGHGRYGVQEAARFYFGKDVSKLTLGEAALLAGLVQSPEHLSPLRHPKAAKKRQRYVLRRMVELGFAGAEEARKAAAAPIRVVANRFPHLATCPEIADQVRRLLEARYGKDLYRLGLTVVTTCRVKLQKAGRRAVARGLASLEKRRLRYLRRYSKKRWKRVLARYKKRFGRRLEPGQVRPGLVIQADDARRRLLVDTGAGLVSAPYPEHAPKPRPARNCPRRSRRCRPRPARPAFRPGQVFWVRVTEVGRQAKGHWVGPQAALVAIDPKTREVVALVGGREYRPGDFNRAVQARRQPGSAFKPILYAAALASGKFTPASILVDSPEVFKLWKPANAGHRTYLGPVRLRVALAKSLNTVAIKLMSLVGTDAVRALARKLGIRSKLTGDLSLALGSSAVTPLELTNAYATFDASGFYEPVRFIRRIQQAPEAHVRQGSQVLTPAVAYVLTSMLTSVIREGTARRARRLGRPAAGKTGTTNRSRDTWFVGYTPELVAGVWVGYDTYERSLGHGESGGRTAVPIWLAFMKAALKGRPVRNFPQPPDVVVRRIDPRTGLLAPPDMPDALEEVFVAGTEPKETAPSEQGPKGEDDLLLEE